MRVPSELPQQLHLQNYYTDDFFRLEETDIPMTSKPDDAQARPSLTIRETFATDTTTDSVTCSPNDTSSVSSNCSQPTPRFLQDTRPARHCQFLPPLPRKWANAVIDWTAGPDPPRRQRIKPLFPQVQEWPIRLLDKYFPKKRARFVLLIAFFFFWALTLGLVYKEHLDSGEIEGFGKPTAISCGSAYYYRKNNCGLDGSGCRPFSGTSFAFRCPASCMSTKVLNPRAVGDKIVNYQQFVIGGGNTTGDAKVLLEDGSEAPGSVYRGDSFICQAAIHAGVVSNSRGGCGIVSKIGPATTFPGSTQNGIKSIEFPSYFPLAISFAENAKCDANDLMWPLLAINVSFSVIFSLFVTSPALFFWTIATVTFLHTGLVSEPPPHISTADLISDLASKALPTASGAYLLYRFAVRRCLSGLTAQVEKTVLWVGAAWVGALTNYTLDFIPIQRLTAHDLKQQPGAIVALIVIIIVLVFIVIGQIWFIRLEGRLRKYLALYAVFALAIIIAVVLPDLNLRIHHYIIALLLLPGTAIQTRPTLLYQGLLIGLYVNGLARWGWDSVLQTDNALRGDAGLMLGVPIIAPPIINLGDNESITFDLDLSAGVAGNGLEADGISILVNDVERYRGYIDDLKLSGATAILKNSTSLPQPEMAGSGITQSRTTIAGKKRQAPEEPKLHFTHQRRQGLAEPEFFRFAFMSGASTWDYGKAGIWMPDGSWVQMGEGVSG